MTAITKHNPDTVRPVVDLAALSRRFADTAAEFDRTSAFPFANFDALRDVGLLTLTAPRDYGGQGAGLGEALEVIRAVGKAEPSTALVLTMQYLFHASLDSRSGWPDHLKRRVVREARDEGALINALRVEPDLGTPARGGLPATVAERTADGFRLTGRKIYSTGAPALTWMVVWARTDDPEPLVGGFLVRRDAPNWRIEETWDHTGLRASASHDVVFEGTPIPPDQALGPTPVNSPGGADAAFGLWSAVLTSAIYDGVARAGRDWFVRWANARTPANLGAPLSSLPRFQEIVGAIDALLLQNDALLNAGAAGALDPAQAGLVKHIVTENAIAAVERALAVSGNPGLSRANDLQRHYRDVLCGRIHTPQGDVALQAAGRAAFARARSDA